MHSLSLCLLSCDTLAKNIISRLPVRAVRAADASSRFVSCASFPQRRQPLPELVHAITAVCVLLLHIFQVSFDSTAWDMGR